MRLMVQLMISPMRSEYSAEDCIALRLPDLLEDHLFRELRGNPPQPFGGLGISNRAPRLSVRITPPGLGQADFLGRVGHQVRDGLDGEKLNPPVVGVELRHKVFRRLVILAGRDNDCILDGIDHNRRVDALCFA